MPITTPLDELRLHIGDTDPDRLLFIDDEANYLLNQRAGNVLLAAADACDMLATRFARDYDFEWQGAGESARGKFSRSQMAAMYASRATALRNRANGGVAVIETTRVDGYSDDLSTRDGAGGVDGLTGRRPWVPDPDLPQ